MLLCCASLFALSLVCYCIVTQHVPTVWYNFCLLRILCMYWNALQKKCTGEQLINKVCEKLNLVEKDFFGITYLQGFVKVTNLWTAFKNRVINHFLVFFFFASALTTCFTPRLCTTYLQTILLSLASCQQPAKISPVLAGTSQSPRMLSDHLFSIFPTLWSRWHVHAGQHMHCIHCSYD